MKYTRIRRRSGGGIGVGAMSRPIAAAAQATAAAGMTTRGNSVKPRIARSVSSGIARIRAAETSDSVGLWMPSADATGPCVIENAGAPKNSAMSMLSRLGWRIARTRTAMKTRRNVAFVRIWMSWIAVMVPPRRARP